jgi:hypothetical protein
LWIERSSISPARNPSPGFGCSYYIFWIIFFLRGFRGRLRRGWRFRYVLLDWFALRGRLVSTRRRRLRLLRLFDLVRCFKIEFLVFFFEIEGVVWIVIEFLLSHFIIFYLIIFLYMTHKLRKYC